MDIRSAYLQCSLHPSSRHKTAFSTNRGHYEYRKIPFGISNSAPVFQRIMNHLFRDLIGKNLFLYLDDLCTVTNGTLLDHDREVRKTLNVLKKANLTLHIKKCEFLKSKVEFLGHVISSEGLSMQEKKVDALLNAKPPTNVRQVRSLIGLSSYYRKFIKNHSQILKPISQLINAEKFVWTEKHQQAFETLKKAICKNAVLAYPDMTKEFTITVDASAIAYGAVLEQYQDGILRPIEFVSRCLTPAESKYGAYESELGAICFALKKI